MTKGTKIIKKLEKIKRKGESDDFITLLQALCAIADLGEALHNTVEKSKKRRKNERTNSNKDRD